MFEQLDDKYWRHTPRAIAVLVALRPFRLTRTELAIYIGDPREPGNTRKMLDDLLDDMEGRRLIKRSGIDVSLDHAGVAWLEGNGLKAEYAP